MNDLNYNLLGKQKLSLIIYYSTNLKLLLICNFVYVKEGITVPNGSMLRSCDMVTSTGGVVVQKRRRKKKKRKQKRPIALVSFPLYLVCYLPFFYLFVYLFLYVVSSFELLLDKGQCTGYILFTLLLIDSQKFILLW